MSEFLSLIVSEKIALSPPYQEYAEALYEVVDRNREYLGQYMAWPPQVRSQADIIQFLAGCYLTYREGSSKTYIILYEEKPIGVLSFNEVDLVNKTATLGYWLDRAMQKKGIVTAALEQLVAHYSQNGMIQRFVIKCIPSNADSNAVAQRAGFQYEGLLKSAEYINDVYHDQNIYALIVPHS